MGQIFQGTISTWRILEGENVATCRNPEACCYFLVGTFKILGNTAFRCIPVTQPLHVANKRIFAPSLRLVHCCLNLQ